MTVRPDLVACWLFRVADGRPEILLIRRSPGRLYPGLWQCVTGKLEPGERIISAAVREVREETGLELTDLEVVFETDIVNWFHESAIDALMCEAVFAARVRPHAAIRLSEEHDDARWLTPEAATDLVVWPAYVKAIETVAAFVADPARAEAYRLPDLAPPAG